MLQLNRWINKPCNLMAAVITCAAVNSFDCFPENEKGVLVQKAAPLSAGEDIVTRNENQKDSNCQSTCGLNYFNQIICFAKRNPQRAYEVSTERPAVTGDGGCQATGLTTMHGVTSCNCLSW